MSEKPKLHVIEKIEGMDADSILKQAEGEFERVMILGYRKDTGEFDARATLTLSDAECVMLTEMFKAILVQSEIYKNAQST